MPAPRIDDSALSLYEVQNMDGDTKLLLKAQRDYDLALDHLAKGEDVDTQTVILMDAALVLGHHLTARVAGHMSNTDHAHAQIAAIEKLDGERCGCAHILDIEDNRGKVKTIPQPNYLDQLRVWSDAHGGMIWIRRCFLCHHTQGKDGHIDEVHAAAARARAEHREIIVGQRDHALDGARHSSKGIVVSERHSDQKLGSVL
jgi:hypothetical protein